MDLSARLFNAFPARGVLLAFLIFGSGCQHGINILHPKNAMTVVVTGIALNDLGQVMVFADDGQTEKMTFIRNFYSRLISHDEIIRRQREYHRSILRYSGKMVRITCFRNEIGDLEIVTIRPSR